MLMGEPDKSQVTQCLTQAHEADRCTMAAKLMPLVYEDLRRLAHKYFRRERPDHTLQPTALVHEAYLRLVDQNRVDWKGQTHFFAVCATAMRRVLIDYARQRKRLRRGGDRKKIEINSMIAVADMDPVDIVALDDTMKKLAVLDEREAQVVELRIFGGMRVSDIAQYLGVSNRTVESDWKHAKAWLRLRLSEETAA